MENKVNTIKGNNPIVVAMSGGVDSSVAAALMKQDYEDVIGVTLRLYDEKKVANSKTCCSGADIMDAKKIANTITIPHYVFDYEEIFRKNVIEPFINEYKSGRTPIPCINCNEKVKFLDLLNFAKEINKHLIITRGEKGAISVFHDKISEIGVKNNLKIVDLTGAGDLFAAGYLHELIKNSSPKKCLEKGTELSSKIIQQIGARF